MKKRCFMMFLSMMVIMTSIPVPVMAEPVVSVTEIAVSENSTENVDIMTKEEMDIEPESAAPESMEEYEKRINSMNGYIPLPEDETAEMDAPSAERVTADRAASLPEKYDPRPENKVSAVREQIGGTCWLFTAVAAIESNLIKQGLADHTIDLSELQIAYFLYHSYKDPLGYYSDNTGKGKNGTLLSGSTLWDYMEGGQEDAVIKFLETGVSPVYESEAPFWINLQYDAYGVPYYERPTEEEVNARVLDESLTRKKYFRLKDTHVASLKDNPAEAKRLIMEYGAITASYNDLASKSIVREDGGEVSYYAPKYLIPNHAIVVVGWDDNYPKENFIDTPPGNGAWLCKQSGGVGYTINGREGKANGYQYISYYEPSLEGGYSFEMAAYGKDENVYLEPDGGTRLSPSLLYQPTTTEPVRYLTTYTAKAYPDGSAEKLKEISQYSGACWGYGAATLYLNPVVENGEVISYSYKRELENSQVDWSDNPIYIPSGTTFGIYHERPARSDDYNGKNLGFDSEGRYIFGEGTYDAWRVVTDKADMQCSTLVTLSKESLAMKQGETATLSATVLPANTTMKGVSYHTTNKNVAVVDESGKVTTTGAGSCEIIAMAWDGKSSDRCSITVRAAAVDLEDAKIGIGQSHEMVPVYSGGFLGENADQYVWSVSDTYLASIDEQGVITGIKKGTVTVSAYLKADPSVKASCSVNIFQPATGITFDLYGINMSEGSSRNIVARVLPADAEQTIEYAVEDQYGTNVVVYQNGVLTAVAGGAAYLIARVPGTDIEEKIYIDVYGPTTGLESGYSVDPKNVKMKSGEVGVLSFWVTSSNPSYHESLSATSSNDKVVKVTQSPYITYLDGNAACTIQAVGAGSATITIKSNDSLGKTLVYHITVTGGSGNNSSGSGNGTVSEAKPDTITVNKVVYKFEGSEMTVTKATGNAKTYTIKSYISYGGKKYKVTKIGASAFKNHSKLTKITIPSTVIKIDKNAFYGCKKLKSITIPSKVTSIGKKAFYNCKNLKTVTIKSTKLESIGASAFKKVKKNATIKVPKKKLKAYKKLLKGKTDKSTKIKKY